MFLLDENITKDQAELLRTWKLKGKQIGIEIKFKGIQDEQIITFLQQNKTVVFISRDSDFCYQKFCHPNYSIIYLAVNSTEVAF